MKRIKLKKTKEKTKQINLETQTIYHSGFCATDNKNFALFNINKQFLVDKGFIHVLSFKLTEDDLSMLIDRKKQIKINSFLSAKNKTFENYGMVNRIYLNMFYDLNIKCQFYPVIEWFGKASNRLIVGLPDREGKPIGILKTVT